MRAKLWFAILAVAILAGFLALSQAGAETVKDKGRSIYHFVKTEVMKVGDVPGHVVGVVDTSGLAFFDTGEVANLSQKIILDLTNGTGPHRAYFVDTFEDGSTLTGIAEGTTTAREGGISTFEGKITYTGGSGRFAGIKGGGSYTGKRMAPAASGSPAECYSDTDVSYTLPSR
jgi:hypothetical protein